ncbi:hypothetical protein ASD62_11710 [Phycicoccus sp. Root563]|uniref:ATP-grasp fold amidoligase family protein n=1 Tax=Phycicoccus sp. Root563 TaxID=1736562 RepID=UPI000702B452|nr:ATP-grasp fold amidoligase family protein [Phycicoccus sp. Root563]KQZ89865.1 hypothetical protein ASD62_11710 [Phycicoccus sp. Root563]
MIDVDVPFGTDYWSRVHRRERHEDGIPWEFGDKIASKSYFLQKGYPTATNLAQFRSVDEIDLNALPPVFALKPTFAHTSAGVYLIEARKDGFFDRFRGEPVDIEALHREMERLLEQFGRDQSQVNFVAEEVVDDIHGVDVPIDYKFLMFYDQLGICFALDRNAKPLHVDYWDAHLRPLPTTAVFHVKPEVATRGHTPAPRFLPELVEFAIQVSASIPVPMCRIDLYMTRRGPVLGEVTLLPGNWYYDDGVAVMGAQLSAQLGALWGRAEGRISSDFGSYPACTGTLSLDALLKMQQQRATGQHA